MVLFTVMTIVLFELYMVSGSRSILVLLITTFLFNPLLYFLVYHLLPTSDYSGFYTTLPTPLAILLILGTSMICVAIRYLIRFLQLEISVPHNRLERYSRSFGSLFRLSDCDKPKVNQNLLVLNYFKL